MLFLHKIITWRPGRLDSLAFVACHSDWQWFPWLEYETPKFSVAGCMQLTCTVKKLFHFKREIADAKILHFDFGAKAPEASAVGPTPLESPFDAMQMLKSGTHVLLAMYWLFWAPKIDPVSRSRSRPRFGHPWSYPPKMGENLSEVWLNCHAPAEKSVTVQTEGKRTVHLVSRPILRMAG